MSTKRFIVELNGTAVNPYHLYGLKCNPFPQFASYEHLGPVMKLQGLGAEPIPNAEYIREQLKGFDPEFVQICVDRFRPGEMVKFEFTFPED